MFVFVFFYIDFLFFCLFVCFVLQAKLDPCNPNPCQKGVACQSTGSDYMCSCPEGYFGKDCMSLKELCHGPHCQG